MTKFKTLDELVLANNLKLILTSEEKFESLRSPALLLKEQMQIAVRTN